MISYPRILTPSGFTRIEPLSVSIDLKLKPLSSAELELRPGDTIPDRSYVELFTAHGSAGVFRSRPVSDRYGSRSTHVSLEHAAAEINDWLTGKITEQEKAANTAITTLFSSYGGTRWALGTVSPTSTVILSANYNGVLDAIIDVVDQLPDYMITFDQSVTPWTLNIVARPTVVTAEGRLSRNIESVEISRDDSELCTRVYIDGYTGHLDDANAQAQYGVIEHRMSETGYTSVQAQRIAQAYLDAHKQPKTSVSIDAVDLFAITGETLDALAVGKRYRLTVPEESRVIEQIIVGIRYIYDDFTGMLERVRVTLAADPDDIVSYLKKQRKGGGRAQAKAEDKFKEFETWTEQTDEIIASYAAQFVDILGDGTNEGRLAIAETAIEQTASDVTITAQASGILLDNDGHPVLDQHGHYQFDPNAASTTLIGKLDVNAAAISAEVSRATAAEGTISGNLTIEAGKISQIVQSVGANGQVTAASIVAAVNRSGSSVVISADHIDLQGVVTAQQLDTALASIDTIAGDLSIVGALTVGGNVYVDALTLNGGRFTKVVKDWSISGNTLTLYSSDGTSENFSKAGSGGTIDSIQKVSQTWKPAYGAHGGWDVVCNAYGTGVAPHQDTIEVDGANAWSAGWAEGYDDGNADGYARGVAQRFQLATVVLEGPAHSAITPVSGSGVVPTASSILSATLNGTHYLRTGSGIKLKHWGSQTLYVAPTGGAQGYNKDWYYIDSGGTSYYQNGGTAIKYTTENITVYDVGSSYAGTRLYRAGSQITGLRDAGTTVSDTYYVPVS